MHLRETHVEPAWLTLEEYKKCTKRETHVEPAWLTLEEYKKCTKDQKDNILCAKMNASRDSHLKK